jgi:hypothetical protein
MMIKLKSNFWIGVLVFGVGLLIGNISLAQTKILKLEGYNEKSNWLVEKDGKLGLNSKRGGEIVPTKYDLVLPALQNEFSFIVKEGMLGLYDNIAHKELIVVEYYDIMRLHSVDENVWILHYNKDPEYFLTDNRKYMITKELDGSIQIQLVRRTAYDKSLSYHNNFGLQKLDSLHYIHLYTHVETEKDSINLLDNTYNVLLEETIQKTGLFSLNEKVFVIPPEYYEIELLWDMDSFELPIYYPFYNVMQLDKTTFDKKNKNYQAIKPYDELLYTGLFNMDFKLVVAPQSAIYYPLRYGGFYRWNNDSLYVMNEKGEVNFKLGDVPENLYTVEVFNNKYYLAYNPCDDVNYEINTNFCTYKIYNQKGEFLKEESLSIEASTKIPNVFIVLKQDSNNVWEYNTGIYDFSESKYIVAPEYEYIDHVYYYEGLVKCETNNCSYYYALSKNDEITYLDEYLRPFIRETVVSGNYNDWKYCDGFFIDLTLDTIKTNVIEFPSFGENNESINYKLGPLYKCDEFEEFELYGYRYDSINEIEIIILFDIKDIDTQKSPYYALKFKKQDKLLLPPAFEKMEINREKHTLDFSLNGEDGSILLECYDRK